MVNAVSNALERYAKRVRETLRAGVTHAELALAPTFKTLIDEILPLIPTGLGVITVPEYGKPNVGRPDIALVRPGENPRAFIELKAPGKTLDPSRWRDAHDKRQFARFRELPTWALANFHGIRLYRRGEVEAEARLVPDRALNPETSDAKAAALLANHDPGPLLDILGQLAIAQPPSPSNAEQLAEYLAHAARLVRASVLERLAELTGAKEKGRPLQLVRDEFREVLYAHPEAGGYRGEFDTLFSAAFAQTLAFGLLLVREATNKPVDKAAWDHMPVEHPLMRTALRVLSEPEIVQQIDLGFEVLLDTVNGFELEILAQKPGGHDPILYFYEDFLGIFDADAKQRYGVYYTPVQVVRYMVGALDRALRDSLKTDGLRDDEVTILDPAVGTGTFLLGIAERVRDAAAAAAGPGAATPALRQLATRMFGFELLIGPYAVAHYRLHHTLAEKARPGEPPPLPLPRLGIYLADTLAEPGTSAPMGKLGYTADPIREEREEADRIKREHRILAIIGNPPYWRFEGINSREVVGPFVERLWEDLKTPVRDAGWANQLNTFPEFSIAFWRWALWKLFEADNSPQKGVIAFISNRTFLAGKPYAGLRKMLRERFDRIEIIDLRGNVRRRARAGVHGDTGVFNIMVGTAITVAIADGSKPKDAYAKVIYTDTWEEGLFPREAKLAWLEKGAESGTRPGGIIVDRGSLEDFRPIPFQIQKWPSISSCFSFKSSGLESKRDHIVYAISKATLEAQLTDFLRLDDSEANAVFNPTGMNSTQDARSVGLDKAMLREAAYRPLDRRWHYHHRRFNDRPRTDLSRVWGAKNVCLFTLPGGISAGPAVWCHSLYPDRHAFRGSYGGYAFPRSDRRAGHGPSNLSAELLDNLAIAYASHVAPEVAFDAILALLSATSYTLRFAEDLEDVFPHVPFPANRAVFERAAALGAAIRDVETFARVPDPAFLTPSLASFASTPSGLLSPGEWDSGEITLCANGSAKVTGIPASVWDFAVSGYRVLPRWLAAREGVKVDHAFVKEFRDINGRINELIHHFDEADLVLQEALKHSLTRDELGLAPAPSEDEDDEP
jgi:hypothetical protein